MARSSYYAWKAGRVRAQPQRQAALRDVRAIHAEYDQTCGSRRMSQELRRRGHNAGRYRARSLMHEAGVRARVVRTHQYPKGGAAATFAPNRLNRAFDVVAPNRVWAGDVTYVWTQEGWLYLAVVIDLFSRRVVGWACSASPDTNLVIRALQLALDVRRPAPGVMFHSDHGTQFADIFFAPVIAGYRLSPTDYTALSLQIYAPTGAYNPNRLANAGQNTWTFTPTIAYTKVFPKNNVELTVNYGVEFYTTNRDTDYHNAAVSVLDVLALKRFRSVWSVGVVGGWIQQLGNDTGPTADLLDGAKGYSVGMGPMVGWAGKIGNTPVSANLRWVNEFAAHARPSGNAVQLSLSATFE